MKIFFYDDYARTGVERSKGFELWSTFGYIKDVIDAFLYDCLYGTSFYMGYRLLGWNAHDSS